MPLKVARFEAGKEVKGSPEWKFLNDHNKNCPVCKNDIHSYDKNIEYVRTKRHSHIFIHTKCVYKWGE